MGVGAGFAGSVTAERLASSLGARVLPMDLRDHVGGNGFEHDQLLSVAQALTLCAKIAGVRRAELLARGA